MGLLKFWDKNSGRWERVGGADATDGYVPLTGGTIDGFLTVESADPWDAQIITPGTIAAGVYKTSGSDPFDGNIRFTTAHPIDFGGIRASNAGTPTAATDAATKGYVDTALFKQSEFVIPELGSGWVEHGEPYGEPGYCMSASRTVVLEGILKTTETLTPGTASPVLFTLPEGYRPESSAVRLVIGGSDAMYTLTISPDGDLRLTNGPQLVAGGYLSLDGTKFVVN